MAAFIVATGHVDRYDTVSHAHARRIGPGKTQHTPPS